MSAVPQSREELVSCPGDASSHHFDLAHLPGRVSKAVWRGTEIGRAEQAVVSSGFPALDAQLPGGGWPCQSLTELLQAQPALCEWRLLAPSLAQLVGDGGQILLVGPPKRPHASGLAQLGLHEKNLVWLAADTPSERLWTTEQLVKANPRGAVLAWLPQARAEQLRRLQVHAQACDCPVFLFRPEQAQRDASPAPLRVLASLGLDWQLHVQILKRKGGQHEGTLVLPSIPGTLAQVLTPRLLRPSQLMSRTEASDVNALGRAVEQPSRRQFARH
ncbi:protein ImuA [Polaromonas sp. OV174]|uniref:translesion DNA synthesis-associated protein ImuA n=1 Tax=Polaromonas sp. OV174 TaxID=1855300 RepID=UPI0008EDE249|nr:translesion DNA synthesis-associated protein ImuA [Polaromonas sp. OV174]SFC33700.1 protein ImuA [Polaromonas sp. OV174]